MSVKGKTSEIMPKATIRKSLTCEVLRSPVPHCKKRPSWTSLGQTLTVSQLKETDQVPKKGKAKIDNKRRNQKFGSFSGTSIQHRGNMREVVGRRTEYSSFDQ